MGSCCGKKAVEVKEPEVTYVEDRRNYQTSKSSGTKTVSLKQLMVLCLDVDSTPESSKFKTYLRGCFQNLASFNGEQRLLNQIKSTYGYQYIIIVISGVNEHTLKALVHSPNVMLIYLCPGTVKTNGLSNSPKIRGTFQNIPELQETIASDFSFT